MNQTIMGKNIIFGGAFLKLAKETIWHFTCDFCNLWWSFASSDAYEPKDSIFCPHCGKKNKIEDN